MQQAYKESKENAISVADGSVTSSSLMEAFDEGTDLGNGEQEVVSYLDEVDSGKFYLPTKHRERWSRAAMWVSILAILICLLFSLSSFLVSHYTDSSSVFASAFDALLGVFSSFAVAWRFRDANNGEIGFKREKIATLGIAASFIATGVATTAASVLHLMDKTHPQKTNEMLIILTCSLVVFLLLSYAQNCISKRMSSASLRAAAVDYALASAMSFGILISTYVYREYRPRLWWLDHAVALFLGAISAAYGLNLVAQATICNGALLRGREALTEY